MKMDDYIDTHVKRKFISGSNDHCPLWEGVSSIFIPTLAPGELQFSLPEDLGFGGMKRLRLGNFIDIFFGDIKLCRDMRLTGRTQGDAYVLMFCLGDPMVWQESNSGQVMELQKDTGFLYHVRDIEEMGIYEKDRHYRGITFTFQPRIFLDYFTPEVERSVFSTRSRYYDYVMHPLSQKAKVVLLEALRCPYSGSVKALYLEGKALELLAISVNTITGSLRSVQDQAVKLSKLDVQSIEQSKNILDHSISCPITITNLARMVCMNESKLKSGFKHIYGKPIYSYYLDKRMESARLMLETQAVNIAQVADFVGYQSGSSFSKAFYKRYGFYPSEYRRI